MIVRYNHHRSASPADSHNDAKPYRCNSPRDGFRCRSLHYPRADANPCHCPGISGWQIPNRHAAIHGYSNPVAYGNCCVTAAALHTTACSCPDHNAYGNRYAAAPTSLPTATSVPPTATPQPTPIPTPQPTKPPNPIENTPGGIELVQRQPELAERFRELIWVADGVTEEESIVLMTMIECAQVSPQVFRAMLRKSWLRDDANETEQSILTNLCELVELAPQAAELYLLDSLRMGFLDRVRPLSDQALRVLMYLPELPDDAQIYSLSSFEKEFLYGLGIQNDKALTLLIHLSEVYLDPDSYELISTMPSLENGIDYGDLAAFHKLRGCSSSGPDVFKALFQKPWLADSISATELSVAHALCESVYRYDVDIYLRVSEMSWLADGVDDAERNAVQGLTRCAQDAPEVLHLLSAMLDKPWLKDDITRAESMVVNAMCDSYWRSDTERHLRILSYPALNDGISDQEARDLTLLESIIRGWRPEADIQSWGTGESLFAATGQAGLTVEERTIELPLTGETILTIVRYREPESPTMDLLERALRFNEEYMGTPFHTNWIVLYFDNRDTIIRSAYYSRQIAIIDEYEIIRPGESETGLLGTLVHETGHYYWNQGRFWISEGAAEFLVYLAKRELIGQEAATNHVTHRNPQCDAITNLLQLQAMGAAPQDVPYGACNYELGMKLFVELHDTLGEESFRQGFRNLHLKYLHGDPTDNCRDIYLGICHVAAAFRAGASDEVTAKVDEILERRYGPIP